MRKTSKVPEASFALSGPLAALAALAALASSSAGLACNSDKAPPPADGVASTGTAPTAPTPASASAAASARPLDALTFCRRSESGRATTWQCPNEVTALDMQSYRRDDAAEIAMNLDKFAEPFVAMGATRDAADFTAGGAKLRSVKLAGQKPGAGTIVARMAVVDRAPTRYVSCAAKLDTCEEVLRALIAREPPPPPAPPAASGDR